MPLQITKEHILQICKQRVKTGTNTGLHGLLPETSHLCLLLGELHVIEDAEDDSEEVVPPVLLKGVAVTLHDLKHDCEGSVREKGRGSSL